MVLENPLTRFPGSRGIAESWSNSFWDGRERLGRNSCKVIGLLLSGKRNTSWQVWKQLTQNLNFTFFISLDNHNPIQNTPQNKNVSSKLLTCRSWGNILSSIWHLILTLNLWIKLMVLSPRTLSSACPSRSSSRSIFTKFSTLTSGNHNSELKEKLELISNVEILTWLCNSNGATQFCLGLAFKLKH